MNYFLHSKGKGCTSFQSSLPAVTYKQVISLFVTGNILSFAFLFFDSF